jgi:hypothetical protein
MEIACNRGSDSPLVQGTTFSVWNYKPIFPRWADHPRIANSTVRTIHVPFKRNTIYDAISQFAYNYPPSTPLSYYTLEADRSFGINC